MKGILKREVGTGRSIWFVQPVEGNAASVEVAWDDSKDFTEKDSGLIVEYEVVDIGHELFKEGHYQEWLLAKLIKTPELRNADGSYGNWGTSGINN
jgi:hypothetical protein